MGSLGTKEKKMKAIDHINLINRELAVWQKMSKLKHPRILNLINMDLQKQETSYQFKLVFELMKNGSLDEMLQIYIEKKNRFRTSNILSYASDIASGLSFLHHHDIIHRDLKPANLLFDDNFRLKIADFNTSRLVDGKERMTTFVGTLSYMAPEMMLQEDYDKSIDVWSFGVIITELALTRLMFSDEKVQNEFKEIDFNDFKACEIIMERRSCTKKIHTIIDASLQLDPKNRKSIEYICQLPAIQQAPVVDVVQEKLAIRKSEKVEKSAANVKSKHKPKLPIAKSIVQKPGIFNVPQSTPMPRLTNQAHPLDGIKADQQKALERPLVTMPSLDSDESIELGELTAQMV